LPTVSHRNPCIGTLNSNFRKFLLSAHFFLSPGNTRFNYHYSAHYFCKTIIKLCAQIADKRLTTVCNHKELGMASFTSLGVGSNLPLDTLLTNLTTAEKKRLTPITQQQSANTSRLTAYGTLKSALEKFQTANTALNNADLFKSTTVTSSTEDLKVSTTAGAAPVNIPSASPNWHKHSRYQPRPKLPQQRTVGRYQR
jgi:hypothetical protein